MQTLWHLVLGCELKVSGCTSCSGLEWRRCTVGHLDILWGFLRQKREDDRIKIEHTRYVDLTLFVFGSKRTLT